jgi:hypothetical protein
MYVGFIVRRPERECMNMECRKRFRLNALRVHTILIFISMTLDKRTKKS